MDTPSVEQVWNAVFATYGQSATHRGIFREVYGVEFPEEAGPLSYLSLSELRRVAGEVRVDAGKTLGDLGCGRGGPGLWVARATGADLVGIDLFAAAVAEAEARANSFVAPGRARFEVGDLTALRFEAESFDAAMSIAVLWSIPGPAKALAEIARVLRRGARFVLTDWDRTLSPPGAPAPIEDHRKLLEAAGFAIVAYDISVEAEVRRRQVYELYLDRLPDLEREMGALAVRGLEFEAKRALGKLDGIDYFAHSKYAFIVAERV